MKKEEAILKFLNGELTKEEISKFSKTEDFELLNKIDKQLERLEIPDFETEEKLSELETRLDGKSVIFPVNWYHIAASILIIGFSFFYFFYHPETIYETSSAEHLAFYLPDSSFVKLNADSKISFTSQTWEENRRIELSGEAYFEVRKGSRFTVESQNGTVSVLGTKFNINDRGKYYFVDCFEGKVQVTATSFDEILTEFQSIQVLDKKWERLSHKFNISPWVNRESKFDNMPLSFILEEMERQFNIIIRPDNIDVNQKMTLSFEHNDIQGALNIVAKPLNSTFIKSGNNTYILTLEK